MVAISHPPLETLDSRQKQMDMFVGGKHVRGFSFIAAGTATSSQSESCQWQLKNRSGLQ